MQAAAAVSQKPFATQPTQAWFTDLFEGTHRGLAQHVSRFVSCPDDVQEVVQETYLKVFCTLRNEDLQEHSPKALLYVTARNIAISRLRHLKVVAHKSDSVGIAETLRRDGNNTEDQANRRQQFEILSSVVNALPPKCKRVITLRLANGLSQKAIGERLGIAVSTVEKHLAKGLRLCTEQLGHAY